MLSKYDQKFCNLAINLALTSEHYSTRVGAVLVSNKTIITTGVNSNTKSHPLQKYYNQNRNFEVEIKHHIHAELDCIIKYKKLYEEIPNVKLYIARLRKDGSIVPAYPCPACLAAIQDHQISEIIYSNFSGFVKHSFK
jgi:deoxycytidylate deaminase